MATCPDCHSANCPRHSRYFRRDDSKTLQRWRCTNPDCSRKTFSAATGSRTFRMRRRRFLPAVSADISCSMSQAMIASRHGIDPKTVARQIIYLAWRARAWHAAELASVSNIKHLQMDEMMSYHHTRLKPLSIAIIVAAKEQLVLGLSVARSAALGKANAISEAKYGKRDVNTGTQRRALWLAVSHCLNDEVLIDTDMHPHYPAEIKATLRGKVKHQRYRARPARDHGLGELKQGGYDPLFRINQVMAHFRDRVKRLARQTWCTTKKVAALEDILAIHVHFHNVKLKCGWKIYQIANQLGHAD